jgi:hypothetical protein
VFGEGRGRSRSRRVLEARSLAPLERRPTEDRGPLALLAALLLVLVGRDTVGWHAVVLLGGVRGRSLLRALGRYPRRAVRLPTVAVQASLLACCGLPGLHLAALSLPIALWHELILR